ncbi:unnamed protein product [Rotaria magnacalcarata]|uniref:F-box domain-containing protein n=2 Tax=Rotaria magnacalcarata TaxID=392030 RepID=A0A816QR02_9BILA|nr:unnamed protein product [Rotaria magnacalcarata]CAF2064465.1 unnamed protein product [Rotaria magnacalcarata]
MRRITKVGHNLELLPDELLIAIFAYLHPVERLWSFGQLNSRFSNILYEVGVGINVQTSQQAVTLPHCIYPLLPLHVVSVQLRILCPLLDLIAFSNVRSLTLSNLTLQQLATVNSKYMPYLMRLSATTSAGSNSLIQNVVTDQFPALRIVHLPLSRWPDCRTMCNVIRSLAIGECLLMDFRRLLCSLPNLRCLETSITRCDLVFDKTIYPVHSSLHRLNLFIEDNINQYEVELLLHGVPELLHLSIHFNDWKDNEMDFFKLHDILKKCTPRLNYFKFFAWIRHFDNDNPPTIPPIETVRKMSHLFDAIEFGSHEKRRDIKFVRNSFTLPLQDHAKLRE